MERIATGGVTNAALADAGAARAAVAAAGALPGLESILRRVAAILVARFGASHAALLVQRADDRAHAVAVGIGGEDSEPLRRWLVRSGKDYRRLVALESAAITSDQAMLGRAGLPQVTSPGIRTIMHLPLHDEQDETIGIAAVVSHRAAAFGEPQLEEFRELVRITSGLVRRALLLEQVTRERILLAHEAELMATIAHASNEAEVALAVAGTLRHAIGADMAVVVTNPRGAAGAAASITSPPEIMAPEDWASLRDTMAQPGNRPLLEPTAGGCYVNFDVQESAPTPVEQWIAARVRHRAFVLAAGPRWAYTRVLLAATRKLPEPWPPAELAFVSRLAGLLELGIERHRSAGLAGLQREQLEAQTRVLAALTPGATIEGVAEVFVAEARRLFGATHALVATILGGGAIVAISSDHLSADQLTFERTVGGAELQPYAALLRGEGRLIEDLGEIERGNIEEATFAAGVRTLMRVPIRDSSGSVTGLITLGHPQPARWGADDLDSLMELSSALGLVSERAALLTDSARRASKVSALTGLLSTFNASAPPEEVAQRFAAEVRRFLAADAVIVVAFDHETGAGNRVAFDADAATRELGLHRSVLAESASYRGVLQAPRALFDARHPENAPAWLRETATELELSNLIAVRLDADASPVGMIAVGTRDGGRLGGGELHILTEVAAPLAMLVERARVVASLQQQTQRTRAVLDILAALGPQESMQEVASAVAGALRTMYSAGHCVIAVLGDDRWELAGIDSDIVRDWIPGASIALDEVEAMAWLFAEPGFDVTSDYDREAPPGLSAHAGALRRAGLRSTMRVRIGPVQAPLGIVTVGAVQPGCYSETDARELAQIVQPLGVAVNYFKDRHESEQHTLRLEYTNRILARLSNGGSVEQLAAGFLAECRTLFHCGHSVATLLDADAAATRVLAIVSELPGSTAPAARSAVLRASESLHPLDPVTPLVIGDARTVEPQTPELAELAGLGLHSAIVAPLVVHEAVRGVVALWSYGTDAYTAEDASLLATLTQPLAIALEKADAVTSLGESELKYRSLVAQAEEMIFLFDSETLAILDANAYTARTLGFEGAELRDLRLTDLVAASAEEVADAVRQTLEAGEFHVGDRAYVHKGGALIEVDEVASLVSYGGRQAILVLARDISERKVIQRQLVQAQKMESLGSMAGAVAHDFNNLLTTILGFAGLLKRSPNFDAEERENLGLIEDAARRAADLTGRLLAFARGGLVRVGPVDLRTVVADTLRLFEPGLQAAIHATTHIPDEPVIVEGDGGQLELALLNIVLNARDAMPDGGNIEVTLSADAASATIAIADDGPGMDDETRVRIFEPFYTTKPLGSGTGLGMAITYGIIQGHHGTVELETSLGQGTRFIITLPLLPGAEEFVPGNAYHAGEGNLVLVVDDDDLVRRATSATLADLGYNVVEAPGGATAVEIVRARPDRFSAVLLDLVMPGMTGSETFRALTAIRPDLPVVVCTGYAADAHIDQDVKRRIAGLVQKPFTAERLSRAILAAGALPSREAKAATRE